MSQDNTRQVLLRSVWALEDPDPKLTGHWVVSGRFQVHIDWWSQGDLVDVVRVRYSSGPGGGVMPVRRYEIGLFREKFFEVERAPRTLTGRDPGWKRMGPRGALVIDTKGKRVL